MEKQFLTIKEQVELLESRGVRTDNETSAVLQREGYYAVVNGYKSFFVYRTTATGDEFRRGTAFKEIHRLFLFDRSLRMDLFRYTAIIEAYMRTTVSYRLAEANDGLTSFYLDPSTYRDDGNYQGQVNRLIDNLTSILNNKNRRPYIEHYQSKYGAVPIWVLANSMAFGQTLRLFSFQKEHLRKRIAQDFSDRYRMDNVSKWRIGSPQVLDALDNINAARNICAHDERLYCARFSQGNLSFVDILDDMDIFLSESDSRHLRGTIRRSVDGCLRRIDSIPREGLLRKMGVESLHEIEKRRRS